MVELDGGHSMELLEELGNHSMWIPRKGRIMLSSD